MKTFKNFIAVLLLTFCISLYGMEPEQLSYLPLLPAELQCQLAHYAFYDALQFWMIKLQELTNTDSQFSLPGVVLQHSAPVRSVAFNRNGTLLVSCGDRASYIWDMVTGTVVRTLNHDSLVRSMVCSPDFTFFAAVCKDETVRIWDGTTGAHTHTLYGHTGTIVKIAFSPDGKFIATTSFDKHVRLWEVATGKLKHTFISPMDSPSGCSVVSVAFSFDGKFIATGSTLVNNACIWNVVTGALVRTLAGHTNAVLLVAFSPDDKCLATASLDHTACLWDITINAPKGTFIKHADIVALNPLRAHDKHRAYLRTPIRHAQDLSSIAFSPDGRFLAASSYDDNKMRIWEVATNTLIRILRGHSLAVNAVSFSPDGRLLATASEDKTVRLRKLYTQEIESKINRLSLDAKMLLNDLYQAYLNKQVFDLRNRSMLLQLLNTFDNDLKKAINKLELVVPKLSINKYENN